jgi:hypothetical protein
MVNKDDAPPEAILFFPIGYDSTYLTYSKVDKEMGKK